MSIYCVSVYLYQYDIILCIILQEPHFHLNGYDF